MTHSHIATSEFTERITLCDDIEISGDTLDGFDRLTVAELRLFADLIATAAGRRAFDPARHRPRSATLSIVQPGA